MRRIPKIFELNALSIVLFYLIFAVLWILLSDQLLIWITQDPDLISQYQTLKGLFYVGLTALFLYVFIQRNNYRISKNKKSIDNALYAADMATWSIDLDTRKIIRSEFHHRLFGFNKKPRTWNLKAFYETIHPEDRSKVRQELEKAVAKQKSSYNIRFRIIWPDGSIHCMSSRGNLVFDTEGKATHISGVIADITEQRKLEKDYEREKELFESIFQHIPVMIDVISDDLETIRVNKRYEEVTGWTQDEIIDKDIMDQVYQDPKERERAERAIETADGTWHEFVNHTKDGEKRIQQWANIKLSDGSTIGIGLDVTEKKRLEEEHEKDRLELQKVYNNIPVFISLYRDNKKVHRVNKYFEEVLGYGNEELDSADLIFEMIPNREDRVQAEKHLENADGSWLDFKLSTKNGHIIDSTWSVINVTDSLKMGIGLDTTKLKSKERALKEITDRYKKAEKLAQFGHWKRNITKNESVASEGFYNIVELDPENVQLNYDTLKEIVHPDDWKYFSRTIEEAMKTGIIDSYYRIIKQESKEVAHIHELGTVDFDEDGEPVTVNGTVQDITETVQYQTKLQELTERYRNAEKIARFGHWWRNVQNDSAIWSKGFYDVIGLTPGERDNSYESMLKMVHPDDREQFNRDFQEALETGYLNHRFRLIKPSTGEVGYYHELAKTEYDEKGEPLSISGTIQDMTELREFQLELQQRNKFIESTLENLPIGVAVNMIDTGEATLMNKKFTEIYGWPEEVLTDVETFFEKIYPDEDYRKKMMEMVMADLNSKNPDRMEWNGIEITTQTGEKRIINAKNIPLYDQNLMISTVVDVTAQAKAEQRLAESEHNYRLLFQKSPQPMWIYNPENLQFIEVNAAATKHYGYSRKEFYQMTLLDIRPEEDKDRFKEQFAIDKEKSTSKSMEWRHIKKSGEVIFVQITGSDINYFGNDYRLVLVNDITEQKKAERMVLASLVEGENKERARIAQELHDGLGQYLAAANMNFDSVRSDIDKLGDRKQDQFKKGLNLLKHAVNETGQISRNLLPRVVDDYGLAMAIEALVDNYKGSTSATINYYQNVNELKLSREVQLNLYRIAQEGISNAIKYSEASQINVQLIKDQLDLILCIDDNGIGFDTDSEKFKAGLGLQTIKTRVGALGGEFELDSKPDKGTYLHVIVPIQLNKKSG